MYQLKEIATTSSTGEQKEEIIIIKILTFGGATQSVEAQTSATGVTGQLELVSMTQKRGPLTWDLALWGKGASMQTLMVLNGLNKADFCKG